MGIPCKSDRACSLLVHDCRETGVCSKEIEPPYKVERVIRFRVARRVVERDGEGKFDRRRSIRAAKWLNDVRFRRMLAEIRFQSAEGVFERLNRSFRREVISPLPKERLIAMR